MVEKTLSSESIFEGKVFKVKRDQIELQDGTKSMREIVNHNGGSSIVAMTPEGELLLVRQFRYAFKEELYEIPAGKLEPNEDPSICASRELLEETGYEAESVKLMTTVYPTPGYCSEIIRIYRAYNLTFKGQHLDPGEFLDVVKVSLDNAVQMIRDGVIRDGKTIIGILMLASERK